MKIGQKRLVLVNFWLTASVSVYNKLEDGEPIDIKHPCLRKHCEFAKWHIEAEYIVFGNLFPPRYAQFDSELTFRYSLKNS